MKKRLRIACLALSALLFSCARADSPDAERFRREYEIMNGQLAMDGEHTYQALEIPEDAPIVWLEPDGVFELMNGGTGVLYLGFPECPWCRTLLPALFEAMAQSGFDGSFYYYNAQQDRDSRYLDENGEIVVKDEGTELYRMLLERLDAYLEPYKGLNDPAVKRILFPTTVFLRDGEVVDVHRVTVDSQTDGFAPLTDEQYDELLSSLTESIGLLF